MLICTPSIRNTQGNDRTVDPDRCISLASIVDIQVGKVSATFQKSPAKEKADSDLCFSIVFAKMKGKKPVERTLDLQADSVMQRSQWVEGLAVLVRPRAKVKHGSAIKMRIEVDGPNRCSGNLLARGVELTVYVQGKGQPMQQLKRGFLDRSTEGRLALFWTDPTAKMPSGMPVLIKNPAQCVYLEDILTVYMGVATSSYIDIAQKLNIQDDSRAFSITTATKCYDLEAKNEDELALCVYGLLGAVSPSKRPRLEVPLPEVDYA
jgi:hypothetical protein